MIKVKSAFALLATMFLFGCASTSDVKENLSVSNYVEDKYKEISENVDENHYAFLLFEFEHTEKEFKDTKKSKVEMLNKENFNKRFKDIKDYKTISNLNNIALYGKENALEKTNNVTYFKSVDIAQEVIEVDGKPEEVETTNIITDVLSHGNKIIYKVIKNDDGSKTLKITNENNKLLSLEKVKLNKDLYIHVPKTSEYNFSSDLNFKDSVYIVYKMGVGEENEILKNENKVVTNVILIK